MGANTRKQIAAIFCERDCDQQRGVPNEGRRRALTLTKWGSPEDLPEGSGL